jgi:four helix bundle protein
MTDANKKIYDLTERTAVFGERVIFFVQKMPKNLITLPLLSQLIRSGTSVGANYCEADHAESRKDFEHKIGICKKEANETKYWLRLIAKAVPEQRSDIVSLWREADELRRIFISTILTSQKKQIK